MPKFNNIYDAIRDNSRKECSTRSCRNNRYRISAFCFTCCRRKWMWGNPTAKAVYKHEYKFERQMVQKVINKNPDHDGINHGINFLNTYLKRAAEGDKYLSCYKHAARLHGAGATGDEILIELAAIYMLARNIHTPVKDHQHLKYLLGNKFIRFVPCRDRVRGTEHRDVGEYLNDNIGVLLLNISKSAHKVAEEASAE